MGECEDVKTENVILSGLTFLEKARMRYNSISSPFFSIFTFIQRFSLFPVPLCDAAVTSLHLSPLLFLFVRYHRVQSVCQYVVISAGFDGGERVPSNLI